jgi:two-component system, sensor histidine kinase
MTTIVSSSEIRSRATLSRGSGMDGYQLARLIRSELADQKVRLVALTGYGRAEDHEAIMNAGFDDHLVKPVSPRELARALRRPK